MLTIGKRIYWIGSDRLCWGEVVAVTAKQDYEGCPNQVVVEHGGAFRIFSNSESWNRFHLTPEEAVSKAVESMLTSTAKQQKTMADLYKSLKEVPTEPENV